jgi:DNA-binding response OmpR family regulator
MSTSAKPLVLNVDDEEAPRYIKTRDLREAGFTTIEARNGAEALRLVEEHRPVVVLLDVQLPDISGNDVCAFIKEKWPEIMVLMTSATFTTPEHRIVGLNAGADSYLVQPAEPLELVAAVNALLRLRNSEHALRSLNATLESRVRERVAELADANAKLKAEISQRQKAEAALVQSQKMEAVGQLTSGLAHDFNNLLTAVVGNLDLIRARATDARVLRLAENAFKAAERGSKLTAQLLAFSRTQKLATAPLDVNLLIEGTRELLTQSLGANVEVVTKLTPGLPHAMGDANQLELAILNLSINARDAMQGGGTLTIATVLAPRAGSVEISVTDTGSGMSPEVMSRAFDPFFTTKPPGKGTGLGLSQVYGIIHQIGGDISMESEIGEGTTIRLRLPVSSADVNSGVEDTLESQAGRAEKLLVLDDDPDVREIVTGVLAGIGYVVEGTSEAEAALAMLEGFEPDLLIVDFAMPGTNGAEVARSARLRRPDLPVLFLSGFADSAALEAAVGDAPLLRKPFRPVELAAAVRAVLDRHNGAG